MTMYDSEFWKLYKNLQLQNRGWLKVSYAEATPPGNKVAIHHETYKLPTKNALRTLMKTLRKRYTDTEVQIWDMTEGPKGKYLMTIDTKNGKILI